MLTISFQGVQKQSQEDGFTEKGYSTNIMGKNARLFGQKKNANGSAEE